jgi:hypothetical protein
VQHPPFLNVRHRAGAHGRDNTSRS